MSTFEHIFCASRSANSPGWQSWTFLAPKAKFPRQPRSRRLPYRGESLAKRRPSLGIMSQPGVASSPAIVTISNDFIDKMLGGNAHANIAEASVVAGLYFLFLLLSLFNLIRERIGTHGLLVLFCASASLRPPAVYFSPGVHNALSLTAYPAFNTQRSSACANDSLRKIAISPELRSLDLGIWALPP